MIQPFNLTDSEITDRICELQKTRDNVKGENFVKNFVSKMAQIEIDCLLNYLERRRK